MINTLKIGDRVLITTKEKPEQGHSGWAPLMNEYKGQTLTVSYVDKDEFKVKENDFWWNIYNVTEINPDEQEKCPFKKGETILAGGRKDEINNKRIFIAYIHESNAPYLCVADGNEEYFKEGKKVSIVAWEYAKPIQSIPQQDQELIDEMIKRGIIKDGKVLSI